MNPSLDVYFGSLQKWREELNFLRGLCLDCGLTEEMKWNTPVYTDRGKNIVGINGLKEFCTLAFFKGALLQNADGILATPGRVQSARWIKFSSVKEIVKLEPILKAYIFEAIEVERAGLKVVKKEISEYKVPEEFRLKLSKMPALKKAFNTLTPGRRKAYILHFSDAKQSKTRMARVEKYIPRILSGKGLLD